jgi:transposase
MAMSTMAELARPVTGGVDTHADVHVAAVVDEVGRVLATGSFPTTTDGYRALLDWMGSHGELVSVGVEGTGSYGAGLARFLTASGMNVLEVTRPDRATRRRAGKSDPVDAEAAARAALAGVRVAAPKSHDGPVEAIRMLRLCRRSAIKARTQAANQIHAVLLTAPDELRDRYRHQPVTKIVARAGRLQPGIDLTRPTAAARHALAILARRWQHLNDEISRLDTDLHDLVHAAAPELCALTGLGTDTAGALLVAAGDNPHRLASEATFAALAGVAPIEASSGRVTRHRLNRGGNRDANNALWRIVIVRMAHDPATRAYVERRTKEGRSKREIIRCLKRYVARELYPHLTHRAAHQPTLDNRSI